MPVFGRPLGAQAVSEQSALHPMWHDSFAGTIFPTDRYGVNVSGSAPIPTVNYGTTVANCITVNDNNVTTDLRWLFLWANRSMPMWIPASTVAEFTLAYSGQADTGTGINFWGIGSATANQPTDGAFFMLQRGATGKMELQAVVLNGVSGISNTSVLKSGNQLLPDLTFARYRIDVRQNEARFQINDEPEVSVPLPVAIGAAPASVACSGLLMFGFITGVGCTAARQLNVQYCSAYGRGMHANKPFGNLETSLGGHSSTIQPGAVAGLTAVWPVSSIAAATAFPPAATSTVAYLSGLGGQYQFSASANNEIDGLLFSYLNPLGGEAQPPRTLHVTGIRVGEMVATGVAPAQATMFSWCAGAGAGTNLGTADGQGTPQTRRVPLGISSFFSPFTLFQTAPGFSVDLSQSPIIIGPGRRLNVILKQLNGAATASLVWRGTVGVFGYFE